MNDEQYGRLWARQQGKEPKRERGEGWGWYVGDRYEAKHCLYNWFARFFGSDFGGWQWFKTDKLAFAALGHAVREVHQLVPQLASDSTPGATL